MTVTRLGPPRISRDTITVGGTVFTEDDLGGVTDHGDLTGLADDDHPQYAQVHLEASADPTVTDDDTDGWREGARWINFATGGEFVLVDSSTGAAVWVSTTAGSGVSDILDLPTAETDSSLVLAPDGAGGVEFRAETGGGGGGGSFSYLGYTTAGGSNVAGGVGFAKKVTLAATSAFQNIGAYVSMTTLSFTTIGVAIFADSGGSPVGAPLALGSFGDVDSVLLVGDTPVTPSWIDVPISSYQPAGDYWIVWNFGFQPSNWKIYYDGSGSDKEITWLDSAGAIEGIYRTTLASASRKYSLRTLILT